MSTSKNKTRDLEAVVRALTREVGGLKEQLRSECKKRDRAIIKAEEQEQKRVLANDKLNQLSYENKKICNELEEAKERLQQIEPEYEQSLQQLREGLQQVEQQMEQRTQSGKHYINNMEDLIMTSIASSGRNELLENLHSMLQQLAGVWACSIEERQDVSQKSVPKEAMASQGRCRVEEAKVVISTANSSTQCGEDFTNDRSYTRQLMTTLHNCQQEKMELKQQVQNLSSDLKVRSLQFKEVLQKALVGQEELQKAKELLNEEKENRQNLSNDTQHLRQSLNNGKGLIQKLQSQLQEQQEENCKLTESVYEQNMRIKQLQETISEQQEDLCSALNLVLQPSDKLSQSAYDSGTLNRDSHLDMDLRNLQGYEEIMDQQYSKQDSGRCNDDFNSSQRKEGDDNLEKEIVALQKQLQNLRGGGDHSF